MKFNVGDIVEYGLAVGVIVERDQEQYFKFALYDNVPTAGEDLLSDLDEKSIEVIGHIDVDTDLYLLNPN